MRVNPCGGMWGPADVSAGRQRDDPGMVFLDRRDAGRQLAAQVAPLAQERPVVIALPRGGVPVAFEVARALGAPLDVLAVRKLGAPGNPEFGVGAIAEDGTAVLNTDTARRVGMTDEVLDATVEREVRELRRRVERYRDGRQHARCARAHGDRGRRRARDRADRSGGGAGAARARCRADRGRGSGRRARVGRAGRRGGRRGRVSHDSARAARRRPLLSRTSRRSRTPRWSRCSAPRRATAADARTDATRRNPRIRRTPQLVERELLLDIGGVVLAGDLTFPPRPAAGS